MGDRIQLPSDTQRTAVVGRTGSGKTYAAVWLLSQADFESMPWVVVDYKQDDLINAIERAERINYDQVPEEPGIYILRVLPGDSEDGRISEWFHRVWAQENVGLYVDEGYMINPRDKWFNACLTQGRSKRIPMIILSQRPVWLSRFVFSEADYFIIFELTHEGDRDKVAEYIRDDAGLLEQPIPPYHSYYYDVQTKELCGLAPVPDRAELLELIDQRLAALEEPAAAGPHRRAL